MIGVLEREGDKSKDVVGRGAGRSSVRKYAVEASKSKRSGGRPEQEDLELMGARRG
jgi:hypothetical protein